MQRTVNAVLFSCFMINFSMLHEGTVVTLGCLKIKNFLINIDITAKYEMKLKISVPILNDTSNATD